MILYAVTLFLGSFLLFAVQPMLGKYLLPWFGGSPAVWAVCMLFFQALLLAGYSYAHLLAGLVRFERQALAHTLLLLAAIAMLPITPSVSWRLAGGSYPFWRILGMLSLSAGLPYLVLASTSPLLQSWHARTAPAKSPYRLYSLSNLGALVAVAGYPTLIEPRVSLNGQARVWSILYAFFVVLCGLCAWKTLQTTKKLDPADLCRHVAARADRAVTATRSIMWLALSACGSVMLLATTNQLCQDVAVIPLLWLLPLGLYLLSFILCFHSARWYSRLWFGIALAAALSQACYVLFGSIYVDLRVQIASYGFTLFVCCMVCHGELVRLKPDAGQLTRFYWIVAAGGALGGLIVSFGAPLIFKGFWEFHLGLAATTLLFLIALFSDPGSPFRSGRPFWAWTVLYTAFATLLITLGIHIMSSMEDRIDAARNFFGVLRVLEQEKGNPGGHRLTLMHGRIEHGFQFQDPSRRNWPTSYFGPASGIGVAIRYHPRRLNPDPAHENLRIGVVGLGTGTIASYCRPGDSVRFYEINSNVVRLAYRYFTYVPDCLGSVELALGDARVSMEREKDRGAAQNFDVLGIDAFSGDAIPVHLLTRECFEIYLYHLKPDGILAFHISNRYFDLAPVIRSLAELDPRAGRTAVLISSGSNERQGTDSSDWVLITANRDFLNLKGVQNAIKPWSSRDLPPLLWTDDYSNLFHLLR